MASAKLTMIGLYNYDNTIFDNLTFPSGIDKDLAINQILMSCGEFEILYPNLEFMKFQIESWGKKNFFTFDKWVKALAEEFNPLYNYDRHEEYEDSHNRASTDTSKTSRVDTGISDIKGNAATSNSAHTDNDTTVTRDVSAYDATTYQPKEKETTEGGNTATGNAVTSENTTTNNTSTSNDHTTGSRAEQERIKHSAHLYGNIGVTTSVTMLNEYVGFYKDFNLYEQIADLFVNDFCIRIY